MGFEPSAYSHLQAGALPADLLRAAYFYANPTSARCTSTSASVSIRQ